jgi:Flp pilus assembly protein TadG
VPLITAVGCAVDYSRASQMKSKLQTASDIASVGSIAKTSPASSTRAP